MEMGDGGGQQARADFQATKRHDTDLGDADAEQALHAVPFHLEPAPRASLNPASAAQRKRQLTEPIPDANPAPGIASGAAEGTRTLDIQLGKLTLYQLSYSRSRGAELRSGALGAQGAERGSWGANARACSLRHPRQRPPLDRTA